MAADYRFIGTSPALDVTLVTDGVRNGKTFFVTELRSYDPADIMAGLDFRIEEQTEAGLIQVAMDRSLFLYRTDVLGEACLVLPGTPAGRFNGTSSRLSVAGINYTDGSGNINTSITTEITFRFSMQDIVDLGFASNVFLVASSNFGNVLCFRLSELSPRDGNMAVSAFVATEIAGNNWSSTLTREFFEMEFQVDTCYTIRAEFSRLGNDAILNTFINGNQVIAAEGTLGTITASTPTTVVLGVGNLAVVPMGYFSGIMRNFVVSIGGVEVINIVDPSAGTNTGTGADGTPTDITSVTVIT